ncbi:uncharacterized protein LOC129909329 [Episyrphus balteatus]|uniref:uncharacterized protein LOC129909329 n=1 Tax=Episyrphus balteatus TaxID=286459 RepID=UPI0024854765|nr:uncharacterized protein LOC129909329 [Episyrphus balteatus]
MKVFVAFSTLLAVASASTLYLAPGHLIAPSSSSQYHSQDGIGQYAYGYNDHLSTKQEVKSLDGTTRGSYSYIDSNNILQTANYVADAGGFRVSATNLPKPVEAPVIPAQNVPQQVSDSLEVAAAKSAHFAAVNEAKQRLGLQDLIPLAVAGLPQQVQDTPEVAKAKVEHFAAIQAAKNKVGYQVLAVPAPIELPQPVQDTPEVAKAKAEHLLAVEQAKLTNSIASIGSGIYLVQSSKNSQSPIQLSTSSSVPLPSQGFSYSSSVVNTPILHYSYAPYYQVVQSFCHCLLNQTSQKRVLVHIVTSSVFDFHHHFQLVPYRNSTNMKLFVAFSTLLAVASASTLYLAPGHLIAPAISSQYHSQDGIGQYAYGYNDHLSTKQEVKSLDGITRGSYSYIDSNKILQTANYVADAGGFRVSATNLPKPVEAPVIPAQNLPQQVSDSLEVAAAKSAHFAAINEAKLRLGGQKLLPLSVSGIPQQVQDTPEVAKAKAEHFTAIQAAKNRVGYQVIAVPAPIELPRPVQDTPEVAQAKAEHFAAIAAAKNQIGYQVLTVPAPIELPQPVVDTPEVAKAKAEHLLAIEQAKLRSSYSAIGNGISIVQSAPLVASPIQLSASSSVPLPSQGFSYSSSVVNVPTPVANYAITPYYIVNPKL